MRFIKHSILFLIFAFVPVVFYAQTEAEIKVQADKFFETEKYLEATPLYLRLIALQPRDVTYNYKYGTCLLYNSTNKQDAIRYLSYATNDPSVAPEAFYFLGKALHLNYQFNEAIKQYTTYMQKNPKGIKFAEAERGIQMCQNGKRLMTTISDIIVTDKKEIAIDKFFRIYDLKDIGGNLLVNAEFQTKLDKKNNHVPLIHFPQSIQLQNQTVIYYSSYGENGTNGKDIYVRRKLPDGTWAMPQLIPGNVNTQYDEDFPYMHPDGNYLYFSSKGHNSMGGYDVFRSKYDPETNSFGSPENMDFAISSPDDDMFYVVDSLNKKAYFASARQSQDGKLFVYSVMVDRVPIQLAVVKGNFVSEVDPKITKINLEIKDYSSGETVGKFNSNSKAVYLITFPKGGKYEYIITIEGSTQEFRSIVSIPFMKEFKPLKQKIIHTSEGGKEIVKIINLFDEEVEDAQAVIAEVIKMRSELNINVTEFDLDELEQEQKNKELLSEIGLGNLNTNELADVLQKQVQKGTENENVINTIGNNINNLIVENTNEFLELEEQIKNKVAEANNTAQTDTKYVALKEADRMIKKQQELKAYSNDLQRLNDSINNVFSASKIGSAQQEMKDLISQFNQLYASGKEKEAIKLVADNKDFLKVIMNDKSTDLIQNLVDSNVKLDDDITKLNSKVDTYVKEISSNEIEINTLKNSIYTAKKKDVPAIEQKIAEKQNEGVIITQERDNLKRAIDKKSLEKYQVNQQLEILQDAISNKSLASVTKEQASKAIAKTEKINSTTLTAYVAQQINELEKKDPTLKDRIVVSSGIRAQNIYSDYKSSTIGIQEDPSLTKEDKIYKLLSNERTALKQLEKRLEEIEKLRETDKTNEQLNREKSLLQIYKQEIEEQIAKHEKLVENIVSQNGSNDPETIVSALVSGYSDNMKAVASNSNLSVEEKLIAFNNEDEQLVSSLEKELNSVKSQLTKDPSNKTLIAKETALNQIKAEKELAIEQRTAAMNAGNTNVSSQNNKLINAVDPAYVKNLEKITDSKEFSDAQKELAYQKLDKAFLLAIDDRQTVIDKSLKKEPTNEKLLQEKEALTELKTVVESRIEEREQLTSIQSTVELTDELLEEKKINLRAQLNPTYAKKIYIAQTSSKPEAEKLTAELKVEQELLGKLNAEKVKLQKTRDKDSSNAELRTQLTVAQQLIKDTENRISSLNKSIELIENGTAVAAISEEEKTRIIATILPNYKGEKEQITSNEDWSNQEKVDALLVLENALVEAIDVNITAKQIALKKDPSNVQLKREEAILYRVKKEAEERIQDLNKSAQEVESTYVANEEEKKKEIESLRPEYAIEINAIQTNSTFSENEKLEAEQTEDQKLIAAVYDRIEQLQDALNEDPSNKTLQDEFRILKVIEKELESKIEVRQNQLFGTQANTQVSDVEKDAALLALMPNYTSSLNEIENGIPRSIEEKKEAKLVIENELNELVSKAKIKLKEDLEDDPSNLDVKNRLAIIEAIERDSEARIEEIKSSIIPSESTTSIDPKEKAVYLSKLREDVLKDNTSVMNADPSELNELKDQISVLGSYETLLKERITDVEVAVKSNPSDKDSQREIIYLNDELAQVQKKLRKAKITVGELEKVAEFGPKEEHRYDDPLLNKLTEKSALLEKKLMNETLNPIERETLKKELTEIEVQKTVQENKLMSAELTENKQQLIEQVSQIKEDAKVNQSTQANSRLALAQQEALNKEAGELIKKADRTKNPTEKNYLLVQALERQEKANDLTQTALLENKLQALQEENGIERLETKADLEKKQRRYSIQVGELTREISTLNQQIPSAKGKELKQLQEQKNQKIEQLSLIQRQLENLNEQLSKEDKLPQTTNPLAIETPISYNEEREIASTEGYKLYQEKVNAALEVEKQITKLDAQIFQEKSQTKQLASRVIENPTAENKSALDLVISRIKQLEAQREQLKNELTNKQALANAALPMNQEEAMKMQNLVKRGIEPIQRIAIVAALVPMPVNGLTIKETAVDTYSITNPIPVDVKSPTGLVYRVQIGAFAKPIPQNLFNKFNPVSGEKLNNGITRYLAGYFNNSTKVVEARDQIKQLGYADAFAVAYCDGKRITLAEARALESSGQCVPKGENELVVEVATNTAEKMGLGDTTKLVKVDELSYNQATGAVKAEPIEKHLGLFFTIQVGAFNRPVRSGALKGIEPLNTVRLPNGQIRYTSGMFNSIEEALPKKQEAIDLGIKDAHVTVYYKGERIAIDEALKLLKEQGNDILELNQMNSNQVVEILQEIVGVTPAVTTEDIIAETTVKVTNRYQIVTKKTFDEFPRDVLNRYNVHGSFYYDEIDKTVKSTVANSLDELPDVYTFRNDVDTLKTLDEEGESGVTVIATFASISLPGDFTDWLLRYNFRREMKQSEATIELRISSVSDDKLIELENKLNEFAIPFREERVHE